MTSWSYRRPVQVAVLGTLVVTGVDGPVAIAGAKERIVLARLVASVGKVVPPLSWSTRSGAMSRLVPP
jgi:hypothetical protein